MKKLLLGFVVLALLVVGGGWLFLSFLLNSTVKTAIEAIAPEITQTTVTLDSVDISPFNGKGVIEGLVIGGVEGFKAERTFSLTRVELDVDVGSLLGDRIIIEKIDVQEPFVAFEQTLSGSNINKLLANIEAATAGDNVDAVDTSTDQPPAEDEMSEAAEEAVADIRIEIKEFIFERGVVNVVTPVGGAEVPLPSLRLENLGTEEGGLPPDQMAGEVIGAVAGSVLRSVANAPGNLLEFGGEGLQQVGEGIRGAGNAIRGLFGGGNEEEN